ncbi:MAG: hypothetical protein ACI88C_003207, partial [Acidimicrobiales bacterium]
NEMQTNSATSPGTPHHEQPSWFRGLIVTLEWFVAGLCNTVTT